MSIERVPIGGLTTAPFAVGGVTAKLEDVFPEVDGVVDGSFDRLFTSWSAAAGMLADRADHAIRYLGPLVVEDGWPLITLQNRDYVWWEISDRPTALDS